MKIGVVLPVGETDLADESGRGWQRTRTVAHSAESEGLDSVWLADHFFYRAPDGTTFGMHESWSLLSAVAAVTSKVELGPLVLCTSFRNPALVAKMAATLDDVSGGRLILGLGSGWHDAEYLAFGLPTDHRVGRFAESLEITTRLLHGETVSFKGTYQRTAGAILAPPPQRRIPVLVAAEKPRMLGLTARWADAWITAWYGRPDALLHETLARFEAALTEADRDPAAVARMVGVSVRDADQPAVPEPEENAIDGDVDDLARALDAYAALGIDHLVVGLEPITARSVARLAAARKLTGH